MTEKSKSKTTDTTSKHVKNTQTEVADNKGNSLRWYHIIATVVVLGLVVIAIIRIFSRFDPSLIGSDHMVQYYIGCTTSISGPIKKNSFNPDYRHAGLKEGDKLGVNGFAKDEGDTYIKVVTLDDNKATIKVRDFYSNEWSIKELRYGEKFTTVIEEAPDCMPGITIIINK